MAFFFEQSEEPSADERRLEYFSGWDGRGTGVALADGPAAVWVSAGDVRRARGVLSCAWHVLDADNPSQPGVAEWILVRILTTPRTYKRDSFVEYLNLKKRMNWEYRL